MNDIIRAGLCPTCGGEIEKLHGVRHFEDYDVFAYMICSDCKIPLNKNKGDE